jgi:hypothetical protein
MNLAKDHGDAYGQAKELSYLHWGAEEAAEQVAARIFEQQNDLAAVSRKRKRPHGPCAVQLILEGIFVGKAIESGRRRLFRGWAHNQHANTLTFCAVAPASTEGDSTILPQDPKVANSIGAKSRRPLHS